MKRRTHSLPLIAAAAFLLASGPLAGADLNPGNIDINSRFDSRIGTDPGCLTASDWYYGLDSNAGTDLDFLNAFMHEIAHGLGFANFVNETTGANLAGRTDVYSKLTYGVTTGKKWDIMTNGERQASAVDSFDVVWNGPTVTAEAPAVPGARPSVKVLRPPRSLKGSMEAQPASFGPPLDAGGGSTGQVVLVDDGTGTASDACEPIVNDLAGTIALIDRGTCTFTSKVLNAQAAGAKGVIVANNQPAGLAPMGGTDPSVMTPSVGITRDDGDAIKAALPGVNVKLILDGAFLAGEEDGFVRLYAPNPVESGSSISHRDTTATPNLLMEPFINPDVRASENPDLTPALFQDIGWILLN